METPLTCSHLCLYKPYLESKGILEMSSLIAIARRYPGSLWPSSFITDARRGPAIPLYCCAIPSHDSFLSRFQTFYRKRSNCLILLDVLTVFINNTMHISDNTDQHYVEPFSVIGKELWYIFFQLIYNKLLQSKETFNINKKASETNFKY